MNLFPYFLDAGRGALVLGATLAAMPLLRRAPASARRLSLASALFASLLAPVAAHAVAGSRAARVAELSMLSRERG